MKRYPDGIYYNKPRENAPKFVIGSVSVHRDKLLEWLQGEEPSEKGYVYLDILDGKERPYMVVNEFKPNNKNKVITDIF